MQKWTFAYSRAVSHRRHDCNFTDNICAARHCNIMLIRDKNVINRQYITPVYDTVLPFPSVRRPHKGSAMASVGLTRAFVDCYEANLARTQP